jgi:hypothetical protein
MASRGFGGWLVMRWVWGEGGKTFGMVLLLTEVKDEGEETPGEGFLSFHFRDLALSKTC